MKLFVAGPACAGKTTLSTYLRARGYDTVDVDDEIARENDGVWPDIPTKNAVILPRVVAKLARMENVIVFGHLTVEHTRGLRDAGFRTVLLELSPDEIRRRDAKRHAEEGWTNIQWFEHSQRSIAELRAAGVFDHSLDAERDVGTVAADIVRLATASG